MVHMVRKLSRGSRVLVIALYGVIAALVAASVAPNSLRFTYPGLLQYRQFGSRSCFQTPIRGRGLIAVQCQSSPDESSAPNFSHILLPTLAVFATCAVAITPANASDKTAVQAVLEQLPKGQVGEKPTVVEHMFNQLPPGSTDKAKRSILSELASSVMTSRACPIPLKNALATTPDPAQEVYKNFDRQPW